MPEVLALIFRSAFGTDAVFGGIAGSAIEEQATKKNALEITVKLDSGQLVAVVQEAAGETYYPGDRVRAIR